MLTVLDENTCHALAVKFRTRMGSEDVLEVLYKLFQHFGNPEFVRSDNSPEITSKVNQRRLEKVGAKLPGEKGHPHVILPDAGLFLQQNLRSELADRIAFFSTRPAVEPGCSVSLFVWRDSP